MNSTYFEILKNIKVNDLTLGIISFINLIYPAFITWYLFDIEFIINNDVSTLLFVSISFGFLFNVITLHNLAYRFSMSDSTFTFDSIKSIMPLIIAYQALDFIILALLTFSFIDIFTKDMFNPQFNIFHTFTLYFIFSFIKAWIKKKRNSNPTFSHYM